MRLDITSKYAIGDISGKILCYDIFLGEAEFVEREHVNDFHLEIQYFYNDEGLLERSIRERFPHGETRFLKLSEDNLRTVEIRTISDDTFLKEFFVDTKKELPPEKEVIYQVVSKDGKIFCIDPESKTKRPKFMDPSEATSQIIFPFWCDSKEKLMRFLSSRIISWWKDEDWKVFDGVTLQETQNIDCEHSLWSFYNHPLTLWEDEEEEILEDGPKTYVLVRKGDREFLCKDSLGNQVFLDILEINQMNLVTFRVPEEFSEGCYYRQVIFSDDKIILV